MKRKLLITLMLLFSFTFSITNRVGAELNSYSTKQIHKDFYDDFYDAFLALINPYAERAIKEKYPSRSYSLWNAKIISIKRVNSEYSNYDFIVKVAYDTFTGPHNPPESVVTITFKVKTIMS